MPRPPLQEFGYQAGIKGELQEVPTTCADPQDADVADGGENITSPSLASLIAPKSWLSVAGPVSRGRVSCTNLVYFYQPYLSFTHT